MNRAKIVEDLERLQLATTDIGRAVYYAKAFKPNRDIDLQLDQILKILGITNPEQVGLSGKALDYIAEVAHE